MINERTLRVLEFTKIRAQLTELTVSEMGAQIAQELVPSSNMSDIGTWQEETEEGHVLYTYLGGHPLAPFYDVRTQLRIAQAGGTLAPKALLDIAASLRVARSTNKTLLTDKENTPRIQEYARRLVALRPLEEAIMTAILSEDEISDHASGELMTIRRGMRRCNERVREKLNAMIHNTTFQKYLQDAIITMRQDRYVLQVKQEYRQNVPGIVHDQSSTGATLFIEPMAVVEIGNELKQFAARERAEIERILQELSARVAPEAEVIEQNLLILARLDFIFAKAALSRAMFAVSPQINDTGYIHLKRARHPLLDPQKVVPSDLWLGKEFTSLIITGPNTGGKTVTLKTVGLLTLMAQAGLHVPADMGTQISVFDDVFADIGDEQSIEQSLSTFSSHMKNIVEFLAQVTPKSLVLFDELGAGTDPTEGAALAQAILTTLLGRQIRTMATTHYSELKEYALTTPGVENASVEFDIATLRPTYRLSIGIPGKSNAFEISRKLGLGEDIIDRAKELLSSEAVRFEDVIANAEYHRQIAEREREIAQEASMEMVRIRNQADAERKKLEEQRDKAIRKAKEDAKKIMENARREADEIISDLKRLRREQNAPQHEVQKLKQRLSSGIDAMSEALTEPVENFTPPKTLKEGDVVRIVHLNTEATVLKAPDAKDEVLVQAGVMKMKVHRTQLAAPRKAEGKATTRKSTVSARVSVGARTVRTELDLRGMMLEEALQETDKFLDDAVLSSLGEVYLIHGKGTGTLRNGIQQHLKRHPHVKEYRLGRYGEGEDGVTVVALK